MKAIQVSAPGTVDHLSYVDAEQLLAGPGEILVRVVASGVNFIDIYVREGRYSTPFPLIPGQEAAGIVVRLGEGVENIAVGERVAWCSVLGTYAEYAIAPATRVVRVPNGLSLDLAAAVLLQGMTAHYLTRSLYEVAQGDQVLVHAGAGGVGLLLTQMASRLGASVTATVSSPAKALLAARSGASKTILYGQASGANAYEEIYGTMHVVYDSVGLSTFEESIKCLRDRGTLALYGTASGKVPPFDLERLASGSLFVSRPILRHYTATAEELAWRASEVFASVLAGDLKVNIGRVYPLSEAQAAQTDLESRASSGKLLLQIQAE